MHNYFEDRQLATRPQVAGPKPTNHNFVPEGKVRHVVISNTDVIANMTPTGTDDSGKLSTGERVLDSSQHTEDLWYTNGSDHLLLYFVDSYAGVPKERVWVDEQNMYFHSIEAAQDTIVVPGIGVTPDSAGFVLKTDYSTHFFDSYGPDPGVVSRTLKLPGAHLIGNSFLNGRPVIELETASSGYPDEIQNEADVPAEYYTSPTPEPILMSPKDLAVPRWHLLIDAQTYQLLQSRYTISHIKGPMSGKIETRTSKVLLDETKDLSEFPPDYFKFKMQPGWRLEEDATPVSTPIATPTRADTP